MTANDCLPLPEERAHLLRLALHLARDWSTAEDLVQETFLRTHDSLARTGQYRRTVLTNLFRNVTRRDRCGPVWRDALEAEDVPGTDHTATPPGALERKESLHALSHALAALSPRLRAVVEMRCLEGRSYAEIGRTLGRTPDLVRCDKYRALRHMGRTLRAESRGIPPTDGRRCHLVLVEPPDQGKHT